MMHFSMLEKVFISTLIIVQGQQKEWNQFVFGRRALLMSSLSTEGLFLFTPSFQGLPEPGLC